MIDIREHGGVFGEGGYKPNDYIPSWKLTPVIQDIGNLPRRTSGAPNNYRVPIKYDKSIKRIFVGNGGIEAWNTDGSFISRSNLGNITTNELHLGTNSIFISSSNVLSKGDKGLNGFSQLAINMARGMIPWNDGKIYVYDVTKKQVFTINTDAAPQISWTVILSLKDALSSVTTFTRDENFLYLGTSTGKIQVFDLVGTLIKTFDVAGTELSQLYLENGYFYFVAGGKTIYKANVNTGAIIWSVTNNNGTLSGELAFDKKFIFAPVTSGLMNMFIVKESTGEIEFTGKIEKGSYIDTNDSRFLQCIDMVDGYAYMTHRISSDPYSYNFNTIIWPIQLKVTR